MSAHENPYEQDKYDRLFEFDSYTGSTAQLSNTACFYHLGNTRDKIYISNVLSEVDRNLSKVYI